MTAQESETEEQIASTFGGKLQQFEYRALRSSTIARRSSSATLTQSKIQVVTTKSKGKNRATATPSSHSTSQSPSRVSKKSRSSSKYAAPSKYAHLNELRDVLEPGLICVFIGANPGVQTASSGHAYAHPSNLFWKLLHSSGCTDRRCKPEEDGDLPRLYSMGNTNIVARPTKDTAELSKEEMAAGTQILDEKILKYKPEAVCIVGKGIWESVWRYRYGRNPTAKEFHYGWQDEKESMGKSKTAEPDGHGGTWKGAKVFVATTTSGLAATLKREEKEAIWRPFGEWVQQRRLERSQAAPDS